MDANMGATRVVSDVRTFCALETFRRLEVLENHLMEHFCQSLAQGTLIRARWPHTHIPEQCRHAAEVQTDRAWPDICPNESVSENWKIDPLNRIHWLQPEKTKFRMEGWQSWNIEAAKFNPERAITKDSPVSYRCESQYYDLAKTGESILGDPSEIRDLLELPNPASPDYTDEVPLRFRECIQAVRDALRPRSRERQAELEVYEDEPRERIPGRGDSSVEYLDMRGSFSSMITPVALVAALGTASSFQAFVFDKKGISSSSFSGRSSWMMPRSTRTWSGKIIQ